MGTSSPSEIVPGLRPLRCRQRRMRRGGREVKPFHYRHHGMLACVGSDKDLTDLSAVKGHGFTTGLFWRSAHLTEPVSRF